MPEDNGQRLARTGDQETDEILGEIEREGNAADVDEDSLPEVPENGARRGEMEDAESEDELDETNESGDETEEEETDEELEYSAASPRTSESTSIKEQRREEYWKDKAKKLEAELAKASQVQSQTELREKIKSIAVKYNMSEESLTEFAGVISESIASKVIKPEQLERIERASEYAQREAENERQDSLFDMEFREQVIPLLSEDDDADEVYARLYEEAFAPIPENNFDPRTGRPSRSLVQIFVGSKPREIRRSGESSRIRSGGRTMVKPISQMSADEIADMDDDQFDRLSDEAALSSPNLVRPNKRTL